MEIDRELGPPSASTIVSTEASIVAAITLTTSSRMPSRVQDAKTDPVLRRNRTASRPPSVSIADKNEREAFSSADNDFRPRPTPFHSRRPDPLVYPLKKVAMRARKAADAKRWTRICAIVRRAFAILTQFVDVSTNDNGVFASAIVPSRRERLRQNVCQKSDSIPVTEYRMRLRAVDKRVQGGAERLARPRSKDVEATLRSTSTSRSVPVRGPSIEVRRVGRKE